MQRKCISAVLWHSLTKHASNIHPNVLYSYYQTVTHGESCRIIKKFFFRLSPYFSAFEPPKQKFLQTGTCQWPITLPHPQNSLFRKEISACAAVHMRYVIDACDCVRPIILFPPMMGTSFMLIALTRLIISKPKHRVTWSHRTCINFPFLRGKESNT